MLPWGRRSLEECILIEFLFKKCVWPQGYCLVSESFIFSLLLVVVQKGAKPCTVNWVNDENEKALIKLKGWWKLMMIAKRKRKENSQSVTCAQSVTININIWLTLHLIPQLPHCIHKSKKQWSMWEPSFFFLVLLLIYSLSKLEA